MLFKYWCIINTNYSEMRIYVLYIISIYIYYMLTIYAVSIIVS